MGGLSINGKVIDVIHFTLLTGTSLSRCWVTGRKGEEMCEVELQEETLPK